jgi:1-deoxy-D-xylulose-5-phosphate reductoisomerase
MVQFCDGSVKAQMGLPDMKLPILYAIGYPNRLPSTFPRMELNACMNLQFELPDRNTFRNLDLAYEAMNKAGNMPCILNAANEIAVNAFLNDQIGFLEMSDLIEFCMGKISYIKKPTLQDYIDTDKETRILAEENLRLFALLAK